MTKGGYRTTIEIPATAEIQGEETEVLVEAEIMTPIPPTIRMDPDDSDPGDSGEVHVLKVTDEETGEDLTGRVDTDALEDIVSRHAFRLAEEEELGRYEFEMELRADDERHRKRSGDW